MTEIKVSRPGQEDITVSILPGQDLYAALTAAGLLSAPCGGGGKCGKCGVRVLEGELPVLEGDKKFFTPAQLAEGWRLSCLHQAVPLRLELPAAADSAEIRIDGYLPDFRMENREGLGIAIDIGSTTVAALLVDMSNGADLARAARINSQGAYGQDVLSRISYAASVSDGLSVLRNAIYSDIRILCGELLASASEQAGRIRRIVISGNTTMIHLLGGIDPAPLGRAPYKPEFSGPLKFPASQLVEGVPAEAEVYCLPAVSAFIGGDITAGILACRLHKVKDNVLFLDIGTNGEIVYSRGGKMCACSCATGPALEGMNISCGSIARTGAVEDVSITDEGVSCAVIGGAAPAGVCGSGLLAAVAELRRHGLLDKRGRLQNTVPVEEKDGKRIFPLAPGVWLTQNDIRQVQLAKGAVLAGISCLLEQEGAVYTEPDRVIVAGQFGSHLKESDLLDCGILPASARGKVSYVGNTALSGAYLCLMGIGERELGEQIVEDVDYLELADLEKYQKLFVRCMQFADK